MLSLQSFSVEIGEEPAHANKRLGWRLRWLDVIGDPNYTAFSGSSLNLQFMRLNNISGEKMCMFDKDWQYQIMYWFTFLLYTILYKI